MTNHIKIEDPRAFAGGDMEDYEEVETVVDYDSLYKDMASATTICKHTPQVNTSLSIGTPTRVTTEVERVIIRMMKSTKCSK